MGDLYLFGATRFPRCSAVALIMGLVFTDADRMYPWIEKRLTRTTRTTTCCSVRATCRSAPRSAPWRSRFYIVLTLACVNDIFALQVRHLAERDDLDRPHRPADRARRSPTSSTYRFCLGLQHSDRAVLEHGIETGIIKRLPHGEYIEVHQPLGPVDDHGHPIPLAYQGAAVPKKMNQLGSAGKPGSGTWFKADPIEQSQTLAAEEHAAEHAQLTMLKSYQDRVSGNGSNGDGAAHDGGGEDN